MKEKFLFIYILIIITFLSCTEDYGFLPLSDSKTLVVNACITNEQGPYRIKLYENTTDGQNMISNPVTDAIVTIADQAGNIDVLKPLWKERIITIEKEVNYSGTPFIDQFSMLLMPNYSGGFDSLLIDNDFYIEDALGTYYTTSIIGTPGEKYTIHIEYNHTTYSAADQMPDQSTIDSVALRPNGIGIDGKGYADFLVPYLYFEEPQNEINYYLFTYSIYELFANEWYHKRHSFPKTFKNIFYEGRQRSWATWNYFPVSDRFMSPYVSDFKITGSTPINWITGTDEGWNGTWLFADIYMLGISKPTFFYFQALSEQFYQDGGAFSPAPSSPPTNFNNGAQGFFCTVSVDQKRINMNNQSIR